MHCFIKARIPADQASAYSWGGEGGLGWAGTPAQPSRAGWLTPQGGGRVGLGGPSPGWDRAGLGPAWGHLAHTPYKYHPK